MPAHITCHILDTCIGKPAAGVTCSIYRLAPLVQDKAQESAYDLTPEPKPFAMAKTDDDGRIKNWVFNPDLDNESKAAIGISTQSGAWESLKPGIYKIKFYTGKYFAELGNSNTRTFFPFVDIHFQIENPPDHHYHIPLLLSNHSYTTYRGS